jgi:glutamine---fructose-6-phosphate transaminase (isomerizing)
VPRSIEDYRVTAQIRSQAGEVERLLEADEPIDHAANLLMAAVRVYTVGIGTSTNAAKTAAYMLRAAGLDATEWPSYDFALYGPPLQPGDAVLCFSHSGRKQFARNAMTRALDAGVPVVWVAGKDAEASPEAGDATLVLRTVPKETSAAYTVSHLGAMAITARIADTILPGSVGNLGALSGAVRDAVRLESAAGDLAHVWHGFGAIVGIGAGPHEVSAHEMAIKVNEAARLRARGYAAEQFLHGPQAQMQRGDPLLVFAGPGESLERSHVVAQFGLDIGSPVGWVAPVEGPASATWLKVPDVGEQLAPIVEIIPAQWLAAHLAALEDVDADSFRLDDPAFGEAFKRYTL